MHIKRVNKTGNVRKMLTLRHVSITSVAMGKQHLLHILSMISVASVVQYAMCVSCIILSCIFLHITS
jgi:hypothetical protein